MVSGPSGIRLQEVAAEVGVSHPTVLHHFGSREGLLEAVVARSLDSLHADLLAAMREAPKSVDKVSHLLDRVYQTLAGTGHARAFLWLALAGYAPSIEQLHVRALAEVVHGMRGELFRASNPKKKLPPFEDTYFTILLPALALLAMAVTTPSPGGNPSPEEDPYGPRRFRAWLARLIHDHLEEG